MKNSQEKELISVIRQGQRNLESLGVVSPFAKKVVRSIEKAGGATKICGGGGIKKGVGMMLVYHSDHVSLKKAIQHYNLSTYTVKVGVEGLKRS